MISQIYCNMLLFFHLYVSLMGKNRWVLKINIEVLLSILYRLRDKINIINVNGNI